MTEIEIPEDLLRFKIALGRAIMNRAASITFKIEPILHISDGAARRMGSDWIRRNQVGLKSLARMAERASSLLPDIAKAEASFSGGLFGDFLEVQPRYLADLIAAAYLNEEKFGRVMALFIEIGESLS